MKPPARRVTLITHYYAPERGAPQTRLREMARYLSAAGVKVRVVTGPPHYPDGRVRYGYAAWYPSRESIDGVEIIRLPMVPRPNHGFIDRLVDQGSFALTALAAAPVIRDSDAFVVESPPLFLGASAIVLSVLTGRPYILHVADPWPDFPIALGVLNSRPAISAALALEALAYRGATLITTVTPPLVQRLAAKPGASGKVRLLSNGVDAGRFDPTIQPARARAELGWPDKFTAVYAGTVGLAQGLGTLVAAVEGMPRQHDIAVVVVGQGPGVDDIAREARARGVDRIRFLPGVPAEQIPQVLAAADAVLVLLRRGPLFEESLPTKLLEGLASGRPVIVSADGYAADLVVGHGAGIAASAEDPLRLASAIAELAGRADRETMGLAARTLALRFSREAAAQTLLAYIDEAVARYG
jgi:colanic acid biosynthesis glycosyl transferase WcaI